MRPRSRRSGGTGWEGKEKPGFPTCRREQSPGPPRRAEGERVSGSAPRSGLSKGESGGGAETVLSELMFWRKFRETAFPPKSNLQTQLALGPPPCSHRGEGQLLSGTAAAARGQAGKHPGPRLTCSGQGHALGRPLMPG